MADTKHVSIRTMTLAAAISAAVASMALAQYRVDNSQVRDASNQIGSGGYNRANDVNRGYGGGNLIVTGNVTNGRAFRGSLGYTDQASFRSNLGSGDLDRFYRDSVGVGQVRDYRTAALANSAVNAQPYFGPGQTVQRPAGYQLDPATGGYVIQQPRTVQSNDGRIDFGGASRAQVTRGLLSESSVIGGPGLDATSAGTILDRQRVDVSEYTQLARPTFRPESPDAAARDAFRDPRDAALAKSVDATPSAAEAAQPADPSAPARTLGGTMPQGDMPRSTLPGSADGAMDDVPSGIGRTGQAAPGAGNAQNFQTGQALSLRSRAAANNSQYAELQRRQRSRLPNADAIERVRQNNAQVLKNRASAAAVAQGGNDPAQPQTNATPEAGSSLTPPKPGVVVPPQDATPPAPKPAAPAAPLDIKSLADGIKDPALKRTLGEAESLMKAGKFTSAIDAFDRAEAIANDDPLVFVGRGIAELGGSYYRNAESHFRQAFANDPALLQAKFDLRGMLGGDRLNFLLDDLGRTANANKNDPGPLVLLAFIYYNANLPDRAQRALDLAQERAGGRDPLATLLRENWTLPGSGDMNK